MNKQGIMILIIGIWMSMGIPMTAQVYHTMNQLLEIQSPSTSNPSTIQSHKGIRIYLPEVYLGFANTGSGFSDLFTNTDPASNTYIFNRAEALDAARDINTIEINGFAQTLGASYATDKFTFFVSHGHKSIGYLRYPRETLALYSDGNAQFIGQQINIGPKALIQNYHQYSLGINTTFNQTTVGMRLSYLSGVQDLSTGRSTFQLETGADFYELTLDNAYEVRSTGILTYTDIQDISFDYDTQIAKNPFGPNHGIGLDIGITSSITDKLSISGALYDLGVLFWQKSTRTYSSTSTNTYSGIDLLDIIDNNNYELSDSIDAFLQIEENTKNYKTILPSRVELVANYTYTERINLLGAIHVGIIQNQPSLSITGAANYRIHKNYTLMSSIGLYNGKVWALGLGGKLQFKKVNAFAYTNNVFGFIQTWDRSFANLHIGANLSL